MNAQLMCSSVVITLSVGIMKDPTPVSVKWDTSHWMGATKTVQVSAFLESELERKNKCFKSA